jgi:hypothetical protein
MGFLKPVYTGLLLAIWFTCHCNASHNFTDQTYDLVVVGATFSGIAAAINTAKNGHSVIILEEYNDIGGLMTGGLSFTDFLSYEALGGIFIDYTQRVEAYYKRKYGPSSSQVRDCHFGIHAEPHVTLKIFQAMIAEYPQISVLNNHRILEVKRVEAKQGQYQLNSASFLDIKSQKTVSIKGRFFIDATYEGDLMASAGVDYVVGRESRKQYGEVYAGKIYFENGKLLAGSTGEGDHRVQAYNFRVIMTHNADNRVLIQKPANYNRETYLPTATILKEGLVYNVFSEGRDAILRAHMIPNQKADINDIKNSPVRIALLGQNYQYPDGTPEVRQQIIQAHKDHILGLIYFLQNDPEIPVKFQDEAREWGLAKDEFKENEHFPTRLYIREARRMVGDYVFTEHDVRMAPGSIRTRNNPDAIAIGDYALNCHGVQAQGPLYRYISEGDYGHIPPPFQIPFGVIKPRNVNNLLVTVAVSASHVGFSGLRLEPTWTALGQAAGLAAHLCLKNNVGISQIVVSELQSLLHKSGAKTIYISDINMNSPHFEAIQYFGTKGLFHTIYNLDSVNLVPPKSLWGTQYRECYPYHALELNKILDIKLAEEWLSILKMDSEKDSEARRVLSKPITRGEFLTELYKIAFIS